jgi:protein-S-isoprenylcysteine O-methyltransferase Ste14
MLACIRRTATDTGLQVKVFLVDDVYQQGIQMTKAIMETLQIPTQTVGLTSLLGLIWVLLQTRCDEYDLLQRFPAYRTYMQRVPRFIPHFIPQTPG